MPIYEFTCNQCQRDVELLIRSEDQPICPECNGTKLVRKLSIISTPHSGSAGTSGPSPEVCQMPRC